MTLKPHPTQPGLWVAHSPKDFIGWNIEKSATNVSATHAIVTLWRLSIVDIGLPMPGGEFEHRHVLTHKSIIPIVQVNFMLWDEDYTYKIHVTNPVRWDVEE